MEPWSSGTASYIRKSFRGTSFEEMTFGLGRAQRVSHIDGMERGGDGRAGGASLSSRILYIAGHFDGIASTAVVRSGRRGRQLRLSTRSCLWLPIRIVSQP